MIFQIKKRTVKGEMTNFVPYLSKFMATATKRHSLKDWFMVTRPWSYPASTMPVVAMTAYVFWLTSAELVADISWVNAVLTFITMALCQATGNVWSDLHDFRSGVDTEESYGVKILTSGEYTEPQILRLAIGLLVVTVACGLLLTYITGPLTLLLGLSGVMLLICYPWLKFHALGDLDIFLTYAVIPAIGIGYVLTGSVVWQTLWLAIPIGSITVAILHVNNTRDAMTDAQAKIHTFAMLLGYTASRRLYIAEITIPFVAVVLYVALSILPAWSLLSLIALVPAMKNISAIRRSSSDNLSGIVALDASTAQLQLMFSMILTISLLVSSALL